MAQRSALFLWGRELFRMKTERRIRMGSDNFPYLRTLKL